MASPGTVRRSSRWECANSMGKMCGKWECLFILLLKTTWTIFSWFAFAMTTNRSHGMEPPVPFSIYGTGMACSGRTDRHAQNCPSRQTFWVWGLRGWPVHSALPIPFRTAFRNRIGWYISQGQSMKHIGIDLRVAPFTHGQLYGALSRCTSKSRIKVLLPPAAENKTVNIVYTKVHLPPI